MIAVIITIIVFLGLMELASKYETEIIITPIKGLMVGALYDCEEDEHIIQILFFIFSLNIIWITK